KWNPIDTCPASTETISNITTTLGSLEDESPAGSLWCAHHHSTTIYAFSRGSDDRLTESWMKHCPDEVNEESNERPNEWTVKNNLQTPKTFIKSVDAYDIGGARQHSNDGQTRTPVTE
ncbi:5387_t:CDS:2, partial [Acaulospora morrowiae]